MLTYFFHTPTESNMAYQPNRPRLAPWSRRRRRGYVCRRSSSHDVVVLLRGAVVARRVSSQLLARWAPIVGPATGQFGPAMVQISISGRCCARCRDWRNANSCDCSTKTSFADLRPLHDRERRLRAHAELNMFC